MLPQNQVGMQPILTMPNPFVVHQQPTVIVQQPGMQMLAPLTFGLQTLYGTDKLLIKQKKEWLEIFSGFETNNKYEIYNGFGQQILYAFEDTSCCCRCWCGPSRAFTIKIIDNNRQEVGSGNILGQGVMHSSDIKTPSFQIMLIKSGCKCCTRDVEIEVPPGQPFASIRQACALCMPTFYVKDATGRLVFKVNT